MSSSSPPIVVPNLTTSDVDLELLGRTVAERVGTEVKAVDIAGKNELSRTFSVALRDGGTVIARILNGNMPPLIIESEVATMKYVKENTAIPVPTVLSYSLDPSHPLGCYLFMQKPPGIKLDTIFDSLPPNTQDTLVAQLTTYMVELSHHTFPSIGSLLLSTTTTTTPSSSSTSPHAPPLGPLTLPSFHSSGRSSLPSLSLSRGPFPTSRAYFHACAQRELDSARALLSFTQSASEEYLRELEEGVVRVERAVGLILEVIGRCGGLDGDGDGVGGDGDGVFTLDVHEVGLRSLFVDGVERSEIICISDWQSIVTRPLWRTAHLPPWLSPSLTFTSTSTDTPGADSPTRTQRLIAVVRRTIIDLEGPDSTYLRALDSDDTRHVLDEVTEYNAFTDGFLLVPTLESILATLPDRDASEPDQPQHPDPSSIPNSISGLSLTTHVQSSDFGFGGIMSPPMSPVLASGGGGGVGRYERYGGFRRSLRGLVPSTQAQEREKESDK